MASPQGTVCNALAALATVKSATGVSAVGVSTGGLVGVGGSIVPGGVPVAVAMLVTLPAVTSAAVMTYVLLLGTQATLVAPTGRLAIVHTRPGSIASLTTTLVRSTVPVLLTVNV